MWIKAWVMFGYGNGTPEILEIQDDIKSYTKQKSIEKAIEYYLDEIISFGSEYYHSDHFRRVEFERLKQVPVEHIKNLIESKTKSLTYIKKDIERLKEMIK